MIAMTLEGAGGRWTLLDLLDHVLDKGIVIDAWAAVSVAGIELITVRARAVVVSIDTYLRYAEPPAVGGAREQRGAALVPERLPSPVQFSEAEPLLGAAYVIRHSLLAGERAIVGDAYEEALGHFERAEAAAAVSPEPVQDATTAAILAGQVRSLTHMVLDLAGRQRQWEILTRAFDLYSKAGEHVKAAGLIQEPMPLSGLKGTVSLIKRALELVPVDSPQAGWLSARHGEALADEHGDFSAARLALNRAIALGEKIGDLRLQARAQMHLVRILSIENHHRNAASSGLAAIRSSKEGDDPLSQILVTGHIAHSMMALGDPDGAFRVSMENTLLSTRLRMPLFRFGSLVDLALIARLKGDWDLFDRSKKQIDEIGTHMRVVEWLVAAEKLDRGPLSDGLQGLREAAQSQKETGWDLQDNQAVSFVLGSLAGAALDAPDQGYLALVHEAVSDLSTRHSAHPWIIQRAHHALGFVAVARRNAATARTLYQEILPRRRLADPSGGFAIDRLLGLLASTTGDDDTATAHFEAALDFCRQSGYRPDLARTCHDYGELLLKAGTGPSRDKLMGLLDEGTVIAAQCDMAPIKEKLDSLRGRLPASRVTRAPHPDGLTEREVEVLRLVAAGLSNAEIARTLGIASDTAAKHVAHILSKIGAANRAEAASYAHTHGLIERIRGIQ